MSTEKPGRMLSDVLPVSSSPIDRFTPPAWGIFFVILLVGILVWAIYRATAMSQHPDPIR